MCGIVGYVGHKPVVNVLLSGLRRLEYRGYDSAGLAVLNGGLRVLKQEGKVAALAAATKASWSDIEEHFRSVGIAHTRWATHGAPVTRNAHPHTDRSGRLALVHNGIVENYQEIRTTLQAKGHVFSSDTDSEVLAQLVGAYFEQGGDLLAALCAALKQVRGTFGLALVCTDWPDQILVARRGSPIVIGLGENETVVASDASAIVQHTSRVVYLDDDDVAVIRAGQADVRNIDNVPVSRSINLIDWDAGAAEKGGHEHFMLKEISEQPEALRNTLRGRLDLTRGTTVLTGLGLSPREIADIARIDIVGCGTSMHAGMVGEYFFEDLAAMPTEVDQAAEFRYRNPILSAHDLVIAISQSGETADTLAAVREARDKGAIVNGICNVVGSSIARECGRGVYLHAGPEIGVASTKAFTCQVAVLLMMALKFGRSRRFSLPDGQKLCQALERLPDHVTDVLKSAPRIAEAARFFTNRTSAFFIGRGLMYPVALEGALKLKEISYLHAEGYQAAELKHGPIALLTPEVPVVALAPDLPGKDKLVGNIQECRARKAPVIALCTRGDATMAEHADFAIELPRTHPLLTPITAAVALQLLAYYVARELGREIDQPRNLAKSVTVE